MNFSKTVQDIMRLSGGTGSLESFIRGYEKKLNLKSKENVEVYQHKPLSCPVIVLVDNDDGPEQLFNYLTNKGHVKIGLDSTKLFYHLGNNLYLIKTPELGDTKKSCIEDLFPKKLRDRVNYREPYDAAKMSKTDFAKWIKKNASTIDFNGFAPLLDRIAAVLKDYPKRRQTQA